MLWHLIVVHKDVPGNILRHTHAIILNWNVDVIALLLAADSYLATIVLIHVAHTVVYCIFQDWLHDKFNCTIVIYLFVYDKFCSKSFFISYLLYVHVTRAVLDLVRYPYDSSALWQTYPQQLCKLRYHKYCICISVRLHHPCYGLQCIIQEMRIDLTLERIHLTLSPLILLSDYLLHQNLYLLIGFLDRISQMSYLGRSSNIYIRGSTCLIWLYWFIQLKYRLWDFLCYDPVHPQEHHKQYHNRSYDVISVLIDTGSLNTFRDNSYDLPSSVGYAADNNIFCATRHLDLICTVVIYRCLCTFLCEKASVYLCSSRMVYDISVTIAQIIISLTWRIIDPWKSLLDHGILHIYQKHAVYRLISIIDINRTAEGYDPIIPVGAILKQILYMRCRKVHILYIFRCILVPFLFLHINLILLHCNRLRSNKLPGIVVQRHTLHFVNIHLI